MSLKSRFYVTDEIVFGPELTPEPGDPFQPGEKATVLASQPGWVTVLVTNGTLATYAEGLFDLVDRKMLWDKERQQARNEWLTAQDRADLIAQLPALTNSSGAQGWWQ